jgi:butyrate kinase
MSGKVYKILTINPGSTSTKIGVFENEKSIYEKTIRHSKEELAKYETIYDQYPFREKLILESLQEAGIKIDELNAVVGRGGLLKPVVSGPYIINDEVIQDAKIGYQGQHASNLGAVLANAIAEEVGEIPALFVDPPAVDEFEPLAYYSGLKEIKRRSLFHALNLKATARKVAKDMGKDLTEINMVAAHLGGGISISPIKKGKIIDVNNAISGGPFSPERTGHLPMMDYTEMVFDKLRADAENFPKEPEEIKKLLSQKEKEVKKLLVGKGGIVNYLGTNSAIEVEEKIEAGDEYAKQVYEAMAYQIAKYIGEMATVLKGDVDVIFLTGGVSYSDMLTDWIRERVEWIAPVKIYPGENELESLALGGLRVLRGEEEARTYPEKYE